MFENIPKNWKKEKLENIATVNYGTRIVKDSAIGNEYYVYGGGDKTFKTDIFNRENTLIVARFGMSPKCTRFVKGKFFLNDSGLTVDTNDEHLLNQNFLNWQLFFLNDLIYSLGKGVAQKNLNVFLFKNLDIIVPKSLNEQQEIVDVLDAAYRIIRLRKECIKSAQFLIPAIFQEMFGDVVDNKTMSPIYNLGDVADFVRGPFGGSLKKEIFVKEGYWVYEQYHAINNDFSKARYFIDDKKFNEMKRFEVYPGDILISCSGTMGKIAIVPDDYHKGIINQALLKLSVHNDVLNNIFLKYLLLSEYYQNKYFRNQPGAAIQNVLSVSVLKNIKIILPTIQQQKNFVDKVQEIEAYIKTQQAELENAKTMFQSLLHHSFTGELTRHKFGGDANG